MGQPGINPYDVSEASMTLELDGDVKGNVNVSASKESSASTAEARSLASVAFVANGTMEKDDSTEIIANALIMDLVNSIKS